MSGEQCSPSKRPRLGSPEARVNELLPEAMNFEQLARKLLEAMVRQMLEIQRKEMLRNYREPRYVRHYEELLRNYTEASYIPLGLPFYPITPISAFPGWQIQREEERSAFQGSSPDDPRYDHVRMVKEMILSPDDSNYTLAREIFYPGGMIVGEMMIPDVRPRYPVTHTRKQAEKCAKQIINQPPCNRRSSSSDPVKVTILATEWGWGRSFLSLLRRELSKQLAKFPHVKVSVLVPEGSCDDGDKRRAEVCNITIVEAKKQPGIKDPLECLYFPPECLTTDIVIGVGGRLGMMAEFFKRIQHCKSVCFMKDQGEELNHELRDLSHALAEKKKEKLELRHRSNGPGSLYADLSVAMGQKMYKQHHRSKKTRVVQCTPSIFSDLADADTDNLTETLTTDDDSGEFCIFVEGGEDPENFEYEELDTVAKAVADLNDRSCKLVYIGAAKYGDKRFVEKFLQYGVPEKQVQIRQHPTMEDLKSWFCDADLVILPSSEQRFGMMGLAALSFGLPVLVHGESGFGEALKGVKFGDTATVDSEDATEWAQKIKKLRKISRQLRLKQASELRSFYDEKYSWGKQLQALVEEMISMMSAEQN